MLFQTTQAHEELRSRIRAFAEEEIKPIAFMLDQNNEFPTEAVKKLGELGWMGIPFPKEYGGAPFLGLAKPVVKAHGSSDEKSIFTAIRQAKTFHESGLISKLKEAIQSESSD